MSATCLRRDMLPTCLQLFYVLASTYPKMATMLVSAYMSATYRTKSMICLTYKEVIYGSVDNLMITRGILKRSEILLGRFRCFRCPLSQIDGLHANLDT